MGSFKFSSIPPTHGGNGALCTKQLQSNIAYHWDFMLYSRGQHPTAFSSPKLPKYWADFVRIRTVRLASNAPYNRHWTRAWTKFRIPFPPVLKLFSLLNQVKKLKEKNQLWKLWNFGFGWGFFVCFILIRERFCCSQIKSFYLNLKWHWSTSTQGAMTHIAIAFVMLEILILSLYEATWQIMRALSTKIRHRAQLKRRFTLWFYLKLLTSKHSSVWLCFIFEYNQFRINPVYLGCIFFGTKLGR